MPARKESLKRSVDLDADQSKSSPAAPEIASSSIKDLFNFEDDEANNRDSASDYKTYTEISQRLSRTLSNYASGQSTETKEKLAEQCLLDVAMMRRLNRMAQFRNKRKRDVVSDERQKVDEQYLQLQNLLYEVSHIEKEVNRCTEFKSAHEDIDLITVDQFYKEAPPAISKPEITKKDSHQQRLARLSWELETRKLLAEQLETVQAEKEQVEKDIELMLSQLDTLQPKLEALLEASRPLQEMLDMNYEKEAVQREAARFLPKPLFYAYIQGIAFKDVFDKNFLVSIEGDVNKVKKEQDDFARPRGFENDASDDSDSGESLRTASVTSKQEKKKKSRRRTVSDIVNEQVDDVLHFHPLHLEFKIDCKKKATISLQLFFVPNLEIVTVKSRLELNADVPRAVASAEDLLSDEAMLVNLFPKDTGLKCPNPTGVIKLEHFNISLSSKVDIIGRPFSWAQRIAGLNFVEYKEEADQVFDEAQSNGDKVEGCNYLQNVLSAVKHRVLARLALQEQICSLETLNIQTPKEVSSWFCPKVLSSLTSWKSVTYEDFVHHPATQKLTGSGVTIGDGWFFGTNIERGEAKALAMIYINCDFPNIPPLFCLSLDWKTTLTSENSNFLMALEQELNVDCVERIPHSATVYLLCVQLQYLLSRLDIALEIESTQTGEADFSKEHLYSRLRRGKDREMPFSFSPDKNCFNFC